MMRSTAWLCPSESRRSIWRKFSLLIPLLLAWIALMGCTSFQGMGSPSRAILSDATGVVLLEGNDSFGNASTGTGWCAGRAGPDWLIVTASHVLNHPEVFTVDGVPGTVIGINQEFDVGAIRVKNVGQKYRTLVFAHSVRVLEHVVAIGVLQQGWLFQDGHISSLDMQGSVAANTGLQPGMSGGPLLDDAGEVVGLTTGCALAWGNPNETVGLFVTVPHIREGLAHLHKVVPATQPKESLLPFFPFFPLPDFLPDWLR